MRLEACGIQYWAGFRDRPGDDVWLDFAGPHDNMIAYVTYGH
jgi:hypothetical protein